MKKDQVENMVRDLRYYNDRMTQQALATRAGVSRQTINAIETGKYIPSLPLALNIARIFGKPVEEIFTLVEESRVQSAETEETSETKAAGKIRPTGKPAPA